MKEAVNSAVGAVVRVGIDRAWSAPISPALDTIDPQLRYETANARLRDAEAEEKRAPWEYAALGGATGIVAAWATTNAPRYQRNRYPRYRRNY